MMHDHNELLRDMHRQWTTMISLLIEELRALRRDCGADSRLPRDVATKQDLLEMEKRLMARINETFDAMLTAITANTTLVDGVATLIRSLRDQILNGLDLTPAQLTKANEIFAQVETNRARLATALETNVP